jgi:hypothetical protein
MASNADILRELRRQVAAAICMAQELPGVRTRLQRMCYSLLLDALVALDIESRLPQASVIRIAAHAIVEWRRHEAIGLDIIHGGAASAR